MRWQPGEIREGSRWFRRFYRDAKRISPHVRFKRIKYGFYRLYFRQAYLHEAYKEMPEVGHTIEEIDQRFESQKYYEEFEDNAELTRKIKNYVEGYRDAMDRIRTRVYLMRTSDEYLKNARQAYKQVVIR